MLTELRIHQLRNLQAVNIKIGQCNVFVGANGSGKTSLLESLYLLSRGKSFRHHQPKRYISHHAPHTTVYAKFDDGHSIAIQKAQDASSTMRLGQQTVYVQSALTKQLPTLLIDPSSMDILESGSGSRRQLLDWITFHVKPGFHAQWLAYQRLLKQRNALLKQSIKLSPQQFHELAAWDKGLATHADLITHYRREAFEEWQPLFNRLIEQLLPDYAPFIQLRFLPGYNTDVGLDELLQQRINQDCQTGYTRIGCHRADVQVLWVDDIKAREANIDNPHSDSGINPDSSQQHPAPMSPYKGVDQDVGKVIDKEQGDETQSTEGLFNRSATIKEQAANVLSRGEKKLLITALRLSQLPLLTVESLPDDATTPDSETKLINKDSQSTLHNTNMTGNDDAILPVVLLDDITAELDENALNILLMTLSQLTCQVFITSLETSIMDQITHYWPNARLFHMKQGEVYGVDA